MSGVHVKKALVVRETDDAAWEATIFFDGICTFLRTLFCVFAKATVVLLGRAYVLLVP